MPVTTTPKSVTTPKSRSHFLPKKSHQNQENDIYCGKTENIAFKKSEKDS